jgi:hypothetical protein
LNGVRLRCSDFVELASADGTDGDYARVFLYCNAGFSHARVAASVRTLNFSMMFFVT